MTTPRQESEEQNDKILNALAKLRDDYLVKDYDKWLGALMVCPIEVIAFADKKIKRLERENELLHFCVKTLREDCSLDELMLVDQALEQIKDMDK